MWLDQVLDQTRVNYYGWVKTRVRADDAGGETTMEKQRSDAVQR